MCTVFQKVAALSLQKDWLEVVTGQNGSNKISGADVCALIVIIIFV